MSGGQVVMLHGTNDTSATLRPLGEALVAAGRSVVYLGYGQHTGSIRGRLIGGGGLAPLAASTQEVVAALDELAREGAGALDLVGHSQGGLHALAAARMRPGLVDHVVTLSAPLWGARPLGRWSAALHTPGIRHALDAVLGPSARTMVPGRESPAVGELPGGAEAPGAEAPEEVASSGVGEPTVASESKAAQGAAAEAAGGSVHSPDRPWLPQAIPGIRHLTLVSDEDPMLAPPPGAVHDPALNVVRLQELHPGHRVRHERLPADPAVIELIVAALT